MPDSDPRDGFFVSTPHTNDRSLYYPIKYLETIIAFHALNFVWPFDYLLRCLKQVSRIANCADTDQLLLGVHGLLSLLSEYLW